MKSAEIAQEQAGDPPDSGETIARRYQDVRTFTESLCEPLKAEDYVIQSMPDASPAKWHLAHTSWFFETFVLKAADVNYRSRHPEYSYLFNSYYETVGPMYARARRGLISRPTVEETYRYRSEIDEEMLRAFARTDDRWRALEPVIVLGLHHEQQHQELLLTDLKHMLAQNPLYPIYSKCDASPTGGAEPLRWHSFPEGLYWFGADGRGFSFDNEKPRHKEYVQPFCVASRLVTNGEYLEFVEDGGYRKPQLWLSDGWMAVNDNRWMAPLYWERHGNQWHSFTLMGLRAIEEREPVCHLSYFEADAYARWAGARLPTEREWEVAAAGLPVEGNFLESQLFHPAAFANISDKSRPQQMFGDVWEWTQSAYSPYPGYSAADGALGEYNGKFMCNQFVLRGGSCITPRSHIRRTYRNFFAPDKRWQFTGIRLAKDGL